MSPPITFLFLITLLVLPSQSSGLGVRGRESFSNEGNKDSCLERECADPCADQNPCDLDMFCMELLIAGVCYPVAKCSRCNPGLKSKCPDPCEDFTCPINEMCRAIEFENYCCPKAVCSANNAVEIPLNDTDPNSPTNSCEGVVCNEDPCNCPTDLDGYEGCGYECNYDPTFVDCCPTSSEGCIARCDGPCPSDLTCPDPCESYTCPGYNKVCRPVQFEGRCCPKAVCSEPITIDATNSTPSDSCEGVVCREDPCNCPVQSDPNCKPYACTYDQWTDCCPESTYGCITLCF